MMEWFRLNTDRIKLDYATFRLFTSNDREQQAWREAAFKGEDNRITRRFYILYRSRPVKPDN